MQLSAVPAMAGRQTAVAIRRLLRRWPDRSWNSKRSEFRQVLDRADVRGGCWWQVRTVKADGRGSTASWLAIHETLLDHVLTLPFLPDARPYVRREVGRKRRLRNVRRRMQGGSAADVILIRPKGAVLLFDSVGQTVTRWSKQGFSSTYESMRDEYAMHVRSVPYQVAVDRMSITESLATGQHLEGLVPNERAIAVMAIFSQLEGLVAAHPQADSAVTWLEQRVSAAADGQAVTPDMAERIRDWLGTAPLVPSHGDCAHNIIVDDDGPVFIDFDGIELRPAWFDGVKLFFRAALVGPLLRRSLQQAFAQHLSVAVPGELPSDWPVLLVLAGRALRMVDAGEATQLLDAVGEWAVPGRADSRR